MGKPLKVDSSPFSVQIPFLITFIIFNSTPFFFRVCIRPWHEMLLLLLAHHLLLLLLLPIKCILLIDWYKGYPLKT